MWKSDNAMHFGGGEFKPSSSWIWNKWSTIFEKQQFTNGPHILNVTEVSYIRYMQTALVFVYQRCAPTSGLMGHLSSTWPPPLLREDRPAENHHTLKQHKRYEALEVCPNVIVIDAEVMYIVRQRR